MLVARSLVPFIYFVFFCRLNLIHDSVATKEQKKASQHPSISPLWWRNSLDDGLQFSISIPSIRLVSSSFPSNKLWLFFSLLSDLVENLFARVLNRNNFCSFECRGNELKSRLATCNLRLEILLGDAYFHCHLASSSLM